MNFYLTLLNLSHNYFICREIKKDILFSSLQLHTLKKLLSFQSSLEHTSLITRTPLNMCFYICMLWNTAWTSCFPRAPSLYAELSWMAWWPKYAILHPWLCCSVYLLTSHLFWLYFISECYFWHHTRSDFSLSYTSGSTMELYRFKWRHNLPHHM